MPKASRILVVKAKGDPFETGKYVVRLLAKEWRSRGLIVDVVDGLTEPTGPDVLVFPHFDRTTTPPRQAQLLRQCARVINRKVTDITKRVISRQLISSPAAYDGPVIVKTNLNYGGVREIIAIRRRGGPKARAIAAMLQQPWEVSGLLPGDDYRVYDHPGLVPAPVWSNPRLVVEKFLPEREGDLYCIRQYVFLGDCEIGVRSMSESPLVKSVNVIKREILESTPPAVRAFRKQLGFDFGKFDYVMHRGEPIIFDVARTPSYDPRSKAGSASSLVLKLAAGIEPFLGDA